MSRIVDCENMELTVFEMELGYSCIVGADFPGQTMIELHYAMKQALDRHPV